MALGSIHRSMALEEWKNIHNDVTAADSFVRATAAFDLFIIEARPNSGIDAVNQPFPPSVSVTDFGTDS